MCILTVTTISVILFTVVFANPRLPKGKEVAGRCAFQDYEISFIWDALKSSKGSYYEVVPLDEAPYIRSVTYPDQYYKLPQSFVDNRYTHPEEGHAPYLNHSAFKAHYVENYRIAAKRYAFLDDLFNISMTRIPRRMAVLHNVYTNNYGLIVRPHTCEYMRNGGCTYMRHGRIYQMIGMGHPRDLVVSLTAGAFGTWHFPMEVFVGLAGLPREIMDKAVFHVPTHSSFIHSWFKLLNIPEQRVVSDPLIHAKTLLVPQQGRCCEIYETQIQWLRQDIAQLPVNHTSHHREIILIQRSQSRQLDNARDVETAVRNFAQQMHFHLVVHDDTQLPSLADQIRRFARAPIVIGPHGAGMLFTAFSPDNACIIEFMPMINPECYARIAYIRRLKYAMYMMDGATIKITDALGALRKCVELAEADGTIKAQP